MSDSDNHKKDYENMRLAIHWAKKGGAKVYPNPQVGAVIVHGDGSKTCGYHRNYGSMHAEIDAISQAQDAKKDLRNSVLYCTLEPCTGNWQGKKQPSCVSRIIASGIRKVVIGTLDPNIHVKGKGVSELRHAAIEVKILNGLKDSLVALNEVFITLQKAKRPFVHMKIAQSLDARTATATGDSKWISGIESRKKAHAFRARAQAIITGIGTIMRDDPFFTVRNTKGKTPVLVVLDTRLRISLNAQIMQEKRLEQGRVIIVCDEKHADKEKIKLLEQRQVQILVQEGTQETRIDPQKVLRDLMRMNIFSILLESGPTLTHSFMQLDLVDKLSCFIAPIILGGPQHSFQLRGIEYITEALRLRQTSMRSIEKDILITGYLQDYFAL